MNRKITRILKRLEPLPKAEPKKRVTVLLPVSMLQSICTITGYRRYGVALKAWLHMQRDDAYGPLDATNGKYPHYWQPPIREAIDLGEKENRQQIDTTTEIAEYLMREWNLEDIEPMSLRQMWRMDKVRKGEWNNE